MPKQEKTVTYVEQSAGTVYPETRFDYEEYWMLTHSTGSRFPDWSHSKPLSELGEEKKDAPIPEKNPVILGDTSTKYTQLLTKSFIRAWKGKFKAVITAVPSVQEFPSMNINKFCTDLVSIYILSVSLLVLFNYIYSFIFIYLLVFLIRSSC